METVDNLFLRETSIRRIICEMLLSMYPKGRSSGYIYYHVNNNGRAVNRETINATLSHLVTKGVLTVSHDDDNYCEYCGRKQKIIYSANKRTKGALHG